MASLVWSSRHFVMWFMMMLVLFVIPFAVAFQSKIPQHQMSTFADHKIAWLLLVLDKAPDPSNSKLRYYYHHYYSPSRSSLSSHVMKPAWNDSCSNKKEDNDDEHHHYISILSAEATKHDHHPQHQQPHHFSTNLSRREVWTKTAAALVIGTMMFPFHDDGTVAHARNLPESTGSIDTSKVGTIEALIPIVELQQSLQQLQIQLEECKRSKDIENVIAIEKDYVQIKSLGYSIPSNENTFKKIFDIYSTPVSYKQKFVDQNAFLVYYTKGFDGPNRPNIESTISDQQSLQYGNRNDAWVSFDEFLIEIQFLFKDNNKDFTVDSSSAIKEDILPPLMKTIRAIDSYLQLAPSKDVQQAQQQIQN